MEIVFVSAKEKAKACLSHNGAMACGMDQLEMLLHNAVKQFQLHAAAAAVVTTIAACNMPASKKLWLSCSRD